MTTPTPAQTAAAIVPPLPPINQDPAVIGATAATDAYPAQIDAIRQDPRLSELAKAEQLATAHENHLAALDQHRTDLQNRRAARLAMLEPVIPTGPGYPADASAADRAVLATAFRTALDQARATPAKARAAALDDAIRFGDDTQIRALITAAQDDGDTQLVDRWAAATGKTEFVTEIRALRVQLAGHDPATRGWERRAFMPQRRPPEAANVAVLRKAAEDAARAQARTRQLNPYAR
ncbi:hypothetical protein amrb99_62120 [Actinomadura sp. RB99]|uniref:hypothetical protein n=1 Tax=Actinomadura sp. RB99 TaxID=2691577 RepID=UPI001682C830|nr:hypothetical protein [Actinomadura sp. RB99]MBD2897253.1 hypothetical protein [Actinomadura sp. RB99]